MRALAHVVVIMHERKKKGFPHRAISESEWRGSDAARLVVDAAQAGDEPASSNVDENSSAGARANEPSSVAVSPSSPMGAAALERNARAAAAAYAVSPRYSNA